SRPFTLNVHATRTLMKTLFRVFGIGAALGLAVSAPLSAQQEPIIGVDIVNLSVSGDGGLTFVEIESGGSGYTSAPQVTVDGGGGSGAAVVATVQNGAVVSLTIVDGGKDYTSLPAITI